MCCTPAYNAALQCCRLSSSTAKVKCPEGTEAKATVSQRHNDQCTDSAVVLAPSDVLVICHRLTCLCHVCPYVRAGNSPPGTTGAKAPAKRHCPMHQSLPWPLRPDRLAAAGRQGKQLGPEALSLRLAILAAVHRQAQQLYLEALSLRLDRPSAADDQSEQVEMEAQPFARLKAAYPSDNACCCCSALLTVWVLRMRAGFVHVRCPDVDDRQCKHCCVATHLC